MPLSDDDLLHILKPDMDKARAHQAELSAEREKHYRAYRAEPYGNERPGWSQTVHPTIFSVVEWMKPGLVEVFTGDFFAFTPVGGQPDPAARKDAQARADRLKRYVRHKLFNQLDGERLVEDFVHDCLVNHYGVMKITQRDDFELSTELLPEMTTEELEDLARRDPTLVDVRGGKAFTRQDPYTGREVSGLRGAKAVRRRTRYKGFHLEVVPPRELCMLPGYPDLENNPFVAHVVRRDLDFVRRQELAGIYRKGSAKALLDKLTDRHALEDVAGEFHTQHDVDGLSPPDAMAQAHADAAAARPRGEVLVWECYTRLDLDGSGLLAPCIVTLCEDVVLRGPEENPYGGPPFEMGFVYKEPHKAVGRPIAAVLDHRQRVLSNLLRNIQDSAALSTYRGYLTTDARARKILASMGPGDVSLVPALNAVQEIVPAPGDPMLVNAFQLTLQEVAKESGVNENMQGLDHDALNKTAAGMQMRLSSGMQRQKLYARRIARAFRRMLARVLDIIRLYPPEDDRDIVGQDVSLSPEDISGSWTVSIDVGVGPQERQQSAHIMDELIQLLLKAGLQLGICEPRGIVKAVKAKYEFMDIDVSEYLLDDERMDLVAQLKGRIEELEGQNQGLARAIGEHARELRKAEQAQDRKGGRRGGMDGGPGSVAGSPGMPSAAVRASARPNPSGPEGPPDPSLLDPRLAAVLNAPEGGRA
ncbi:hypothetical protein NNJEOMEG_03868 [Fundidesulfovibrio magnetotacticus]|uniref:Portal protein n=1 Tax=Fundidesulfovibrio magnetotacticus TaxID=2730080 RepID=A0A6V8LW82_9BACT|nr:hypothetical protein [Fundidesulfovibrio magnetotacticus]GFK95994.1 hypothetical protein NNJEOMEG_03868 [Fundidesulfovibrio magnetotacticus]